MEAMAEIVLRKLIHAVVEFETALVDTVGISTDSGTEVCKVAFGIISLNAVETEHNVGKATLCIGNSERYYTTTEISDARLHAVCIGEGVECGGIATVFTYKILWIETRLCECGSFCFGAARSEHKSRKNGYGQNFHGLE